MSSGSSDKVYKVSRLKHNPGPYTVNWWCDCPGFKFNKKCRHVTAAKHKICSYGWEAAAGSPTKMGKTCPECGGPTIVMEYTS